MRKLIGIVFGSLYLVSLLVLSSCTTTDKLDPVKDYDALVRKHSDRAEFYQGFMNVFQMQGTFLNAKILNAQVDKKAESFNWTDSQITEERAKVDNNIRTETTVFLSFFSPQPKIDNLDSVNSLWRVFLDVNNKRYTGTVSRYVGHADETQLFYPYHSRFSSPYIVRFPVPVEYIQDYPSTLTVTGTIGSKKLSFK